MPELKCEDHKAGSDRLSKAMMDGGGFTECDWTQGVQEKLPRIVSVLASNPQDPLRL